MDLTCIHGPSGLCPECRAEYEADPLAYLEFGDHPAGVARWEALQREIEAARPEEAAPVDWTDVPF